MAKLLIVDDEMDVREFAASFFRKRKIEVITASSGEEAIRIVEKDGPQLVLLDIKMEGMDGVETLKRIKDMGKKISVVMVTGKKPDEDGTFEKCRELGATDYIHKPLKLEELENVVLRILKNVT